MEGNIRHDSTGFVCLFAAVLVFGVGGKFLFDVFDFTLPAFRITGGFLAFLIGLHMLPGESSGARNPTASDYRKSREAELGVAVTSSGVAILAGPGTATSAINFASGGGWTDLTSTLGAIRLYR